MWSWGWGIREVKLGVKGGGKNRKTRKERKSEGVQTVGQTQPAAIAAFTGGMTDTQRQKGGAKGELAVVLGRLLRRQNERSQTGERLRHLQKLMLREEVRGGEEEVTEGGEERNRERLQFTAQNIHHRPAALSRICRLSETSSGVTLGVQQDRWITSPRRVMLQL